MSFEEHRLNDMIDLVEQANPADLESAGEALQKARDAIAVAARELGDHIDRVDWEGEAGRAFRKWGKNLVKETHKLSDFADTAGVQIASAGAGLASVRSSMPPRDTRADPKAVDGIPSPKRVEGNADYEGAVRAEKHRQEAINQMNRLASFYRVSQHEMAGQEPPSFSVMPDVGVPRPRPKDADDPGEPRSAVLSGAGTADAPSRVQRSGESVALVPPESDEPLPFRNEARGPIAAPDRPAGVESVGTEIDSVGKLPPQTIGPVLASPPPAPDPTGIDGGPPPLSGGGLLKLPNGGPATHAPRSGGGGKGPSPDQGRIGVGGPRESTGGPGRGPSGPVRPIGPEAQGRSISGPTAPVQSPVARGITGGTPQPRGVPSPRPGVPGITGAPRSDGVLGGRPAPGPVMGQAGPRASTGRVIGTEGAGNSRSGSGSVGQRGVVGAAPQSASGRGQMPRRSLSNPDGVVGTPKGATSTGGGRRNGFTTGGTGLVRGPVNNRRRTEHEEEDAPQRPDYVVEDEATHLPGGRRHVPPVID